MRTTTISNDYQEGKFRTTELSTKFVDGKVFIGIGAANGTFDGDRCFNDRSWTVRIHQPEGWGVLQSVSNGTDELSFTKVEQDTDAMPMEVEGGAADGVVYEVKVSGNVYEAMQLVATFENPVDPEIPDLDYDEPQTYEGYKQPVERTIDVSDEMPYVVGSDFPGQPGLGTARTSTITERPCGRIPPPRRSPSSSSMPAV